MIAIAKKALRLFDAKQRHFLVPLFLLMLMGSAFEVVSVSMMVPIVAALMDPNVAASNTFFAWVIGLFPVSSPNEFVSFAIVVLIVIFVAKTAFLTFEYKVQYRFVYNGRFTLQQKLLHAYFCRPYEYFLTINSSEVLRVMRTDVIRAFEVVSTLLLMATELTVSVVLIVTIFAISPFMTVFVGCIMLVTVLVITRVLKPAMARQGVEYNRAGTLANKWLMQSIQGIKDVKVGRKEPFFEDSFHEYGGEMVRIEQSQAVLQNVPRLLIEMISVCAMLAVIAIMNSSGASVETLLPELSAFVMAAVKLLPSMNRIVTSVNQVNYRNASLDSVLENLEALKHAPKRALPQSEEINRLAFAHEIRFNDVSYCYPNSQEDVLSHVDFAIPQGASVGIVGPSGVGKTTVVDVMLGLLEPHGGAVLLDGVDIRENLAGWSAHIGYIPQNIFMLDDTIRANVAFGYGANTQDERNVWAALEDAQLADFVRTLPEGLDTRIGERGVRLSGGQCQRVGIARALYGNPDVLLFDEATSALDVDTEREVMNSIYRLQDNKTMIIVTHRLTTIAQCDIIFEVKDKHVVRQR